MIIQIGEYYSNKTWKYLTPCLKGHGEIFISKYNPVFKLATGIHDTLLDGSPLLKNRRAIYILCDKRHHERKFYDFLDWLKYQSYYIADYCPDANISSRKHMIVIEVPEEYYYAYEFFLQSSYSNMYTPEQIDILFSNPSRADDKAVLLRDTAIFDSFLEKIKNEFNTEPKKSDFINSQYDLPLKRSEEIFHCDDNQRVYFNEDYDKVWLN